MVILVLNPCFSLLQTHRRSKIHNSGYSSRWPYQQAHKRVHQCAKKGVPYRPSCQGSKGRTVKYLEKKKLPWRLWAKFSSHGHPKLCQWTWKSIATRVRESRSTFEFFSTSFCTVLSDRSELADRSQVRGAAAELAKCSWGERVGTRESPLGVLWYGNQCNIHNADQTTGDVDKISCPGRRRRIFTTPSTKAKERLRGRQS